MPNKNTDYREIIFKDGNVFKFEERGFYPIIYDEEICIYSETESFPPHYKRNDIASITVIGHDFYGEIRHLEFN